jgi:hypothetical protein
MKTDPIVQLLISAYRRGKAVLVDRERTKAAQKSTPTETKIAGANGDSGTRNTNHEQHEYITPR